MLHPRYNPSGEDLNQCEYPMGSMAEAVSYAIPPDWPDQNSDNGMITVHNYVERSLVRHPGPLYASNVCSDLGVPGQCVATLAQCIFSICMYCEIAFYCAHGRCCSSKENMICV